MSTRPLPAKHKLTLCFAHVAYRMGERFALRNAGIDQYSRDALGAAGIRVASAQGVNERAVAEHAIALILAMSRQIPEARDNQTAKKFGMIGDISKREDELGGKTLVIAGLGRIGSRLATFAKAFDMRVIATRRDPSKGAGRPTKSSARIACSVRRRKPISSR